MHHIDGLKEWLEDKVRTLTDPPLADLKRPLVISQQLKSGRANMLRIKVPKVFYARSGSHCYPLGVSQINDIWQRQKSPVIQISEFQITGLFPTGSPLPHYSLVVQLHNISKTVCRSHLVRARIPLAIGGTFVEIPDTETYQPKMTGFTRYYLDDEAELAAYVVEFEGSEIYPDHDITKVAKLYPSGRRDLEQFVSRTVRKASVRVFTDPLAEIHGATEIPVWFDSCGDDNFARRPFLGASCTSFGRSLLKQHCIRLANTRWQRRRIYRSVPLRSANPQNFWLRYPKACLAAARLRNHRQ